MSLYFFAFACLILFGGGGVAYAQSSCNPNQGLGAVFGCDGPLSRGGALDVGSIVTTVFMVALGLFTIVVVGYLIWAAYNFVRAKENPDERKKAGQAMLSALGGLLIAALSYGVVYTIANWAGLGGVMNLSTTPCTGYTDSGFQFTGFLSSSNPNVCFAPAEGKMSGQIKVSRIGCTSASKRYGGPGASATNSDPQTVDVDRIPAGLCQ